jgi:hypothetical protein
VASVRFVTTWGAAAAALAVLLGLAGCSDGDDGSPTTTTERTTTSSTTTAPERPASTTTTAYDPAALEGQVEAAYLRSWDVYADAVYHLRLDEQALAQVYADPLLTVVRTELEGRIRDGRASHVRVEHAYTIEMTGQATAAVIDSYVNHQVLIDPGSKEPREADPNETITDAFTLRLVGTNWVVFDQRRLQ